MSTSKRFLFITSGRRDPPTRFRVLPYLPFLRSAGHHCVVAHSFPTKYAQFPLLGRDLTWRLPPIRRYFRGWDAFFAERNCYDTIFLEREVFNDTTWDVEQRLRRATPRLVLDVDDGIFLTFPEKYAHIAALSDCVIAGNQNIAEYTAGLCSRVELIPTSILWSDYPPKSSRPVSAAGPTIGWIGLGSNLPLLSVAAEGLRRLATEISFRLLLITSDLQRLQGVDLSGVRVELRRWQPGREAEALHEADVGIMPLPPDDPWMRYKCGLKLIQYLAVGIPGVASPVGVNTEILAGETAGRLAATPNQWRNALHELLTQPELRRQLGAAGRQLVKERYTIESQWRRLEQILVGGCTDG